MIKFKYWAYLMVCLFFVATSSCDNTMKSSLPNTHFSLTYNLLQHPKITIPGNFVIVNKNTHGLPVGYGGVILGKPVNCEPYSNEYIAYDAACPVEKNSKISVEIIEDGIGTAICAKCKTKYSLSHNGYPEGIGDEFLKGYPVQVNGNTLSINN